MFYRSLIAPLSGSILLSSETCRLCGKVAWLYQETELTKLLCSGFFVGWMLRFWGSQAEQQEKQNEGQENQELWPQYCTHTFKATRDSTVYWAWNITPKMDSGLAIYNLQKRTCIPAEIICLSTLLWSNSAGHRLAAPSPAHCFCALLGFCLSSALMFKSDSDQLLQLFRFWFFTAGGAASSPHSQLHSFRWRRKPYIRREAVFLTHSRILSVPWCLQQSFVGAVRKKEHSQQACLPRHRLVLSVSGQNNNGEVIVFDGGNQRTRQPAQTISCKSVR